MRRYWAIENRLHWHRDVTLREDHSQVRKGNTPQVVAALNNLVLAVFDVLGVHNVPRQMRLFDSQTHRAIHLLLGSLLTWREPWLLLGYPGVAVGGSHEVSCCSGLSW